MKHEKVIRVQRLAANTYEKAFTKYWGVDVWDKDIEFIDVIGIQLDAAALYAASRESYINGR